MGKKELVVRWVIGGMAIIASLLMFFMSFWVSEVAGTPSGWVEETGRVIEVTSHRASSGQKGGGPSSDYDTLVEIALENDGPCPSTSWEATKARGDELVSGTSAPPREDELRDQLARALGQDPVPQLCTYRFRSEYGDGDTLEGDPVQLWYDPEDPRNAETEADRNAAAGRWIYPLIGLVPVAIIALKGTDTVGRIRRQR